MFCRLLLETCPVYKPQLRSLDRSIISLFHFHYAFKDYYPSLLCGLGFRSWRLPVWYRSSVSLIAMSLIILLDIVEMEFRLESLSHLILSFLRFRAFWCPPQRHAAQDPLSLALWHLLRLKPALYKQVHLSRRSLLMLALSTIEIELLQSFDPAMSVLHPGRSFFSICSPARIQSHSLLLIILANIVEPSILVSYPTSTIQQAPTSSRIRWNLLHQLGSSASRRTTVKEAWYSLSIQNQPIKWSNSSREPCIKIRWNQPRFQYPRCLVQVAQMTASRQWQQELRVSVISHLA